MRVQPRLGLGIDHGADMGRGIGGVADLQFAGGARDHLDDAIGDVLLHEQQPQRRAALARGAERRGHDVVGDLFGQRGGVRNHGVDAAGFCDKRYNRSVLGGECTIDRARHLGRAGEHHARDIGMCRQHRADRAVAGHELQRRGGNTGLMQQLDRLGRDQECLLGRLGHHGVAGHQRRGDLAEKDRERKIPGRDRNEDAAAAQAKLVALAGRTRHGFARAEQLAPLRSIVAAEIRRLA